MLSDKRSHLGERPAQDREEPPLASTREKPAPNMCMDALYIYLIYVIYLEQNLNLKARDNVS